MDDAGRREVEELHRFFEDWFSGRCEATDAAFARFERVLADDFEIVTPDGAVLDRTTILDAVRGGHGSGPMRIWIEKYRARSTDGGLHLATYEEWQTRDDVTRGRLSTVLFRAGPGGDDEMQWVHVHETWLPDGPGQSPVLSRT